MTSGFDDVHEIVAPFAASVGTPKSAATVVGTDTASSAFCATVLGSNDGSFDWVSETTSSIVATPS